MVVSLAIVLALAWIEKEVARDQFERHASQRPKISTDIVVKAEHDLWATILPRLNLLGEVMMSPASISKIANLKRDLLVS